MRSQINPETLTLAWAEQIEKNFILPCRKRAKLLAEKYGQ